ncbi:MAG: transposase [Bacteroidota bacterium]
MTRLDYGQFLLSSQVNYTLTYFADHARKWSHDTINRYLRRDRVTPRLLWDNVKTEVIPHERGYLLFDDTVLDKRYSREIEPARRQWSGNAKGVIEGIGVVTCVYVNPALDRFWIIDYRIFAPDTDGKTKLRHVEEMLKHTVAHKRVEGEDGSPRPLPFGTVLMDAWYATMPLWKQIERLGKLYYCPVRANRQVSLGPGQGYERVDALSVPAEGALVHLKGMPKGHQVKLFRLVLSSERTEYVVTNDVTQSSSKAAREECAVRWKIEQLHREVKQTTGIAQCQCRKERAQRNHVGCALLVWVRLKSLAAEVGTTVYALKRGLLSDYMVTQLRNPSIRMTLA